MSLKKKRCDNLWIIFTLSADWFAADKLSLHQVAGSVSPVCGECLFAGEEYTVFTVSVFKLGIVWLLMVLSYPPSGEVPCAAICPGPVSLLSLICSTDPDALWGLLL